MPDPGSATSPPSDRDRLLLLTSEVEVFALQLENLAVRHPQLAKELAGLSGRMRAAVREHRTAVRGAGSGCEHA